ncbi:MAG: rhodanese-like domain-containing protein [Bacteroidota bacterium]
MTGEILFYIVLGIIGVFYLRKVFVARSVQHYSAAEVRERLRDSHNVVLLDVRTEREWQGQHIKGAVHIPLHELQRRIDELEKHKGKEVICYCHTGNRSVSAAVRLKKLGFSVANMKGGIAEWNFQHRK